MTEYTLAGFVGIERVSVELTAAEFASTARAREALLDVLAIEEKFGFVLANYYELEHDLLGSALRFSTFGGWDWSDTITALQHFNRRVVNLLTTCRLYMDQVKHDLSSIYGEASPALTAFDSARHQEYDRALGYRALEALRNYVQHRGLPIDQFINGTRAANPDGSAAIAYVEIRLETAKLVGDPKFKASVAAELSQLGEFVDVRELVQAYISGLGRVHAVLRGVLKGDIAGWDHEILQALRRLREAGGGANLVGAVAEARGNQNPDGRVSVFDGFINKRRELEALNRAPVDYARRIISSKWPIHGASTA